ncbi:MAG: pyridoxamine 5'-phosphate oxidase family protein [Candidatus Binatia bacterium]
MEQRYLSWTVFLCLCVILLGGPRALQAEQKPATPQPAPPSMSTEELNAFLARPIIARIATVRANGSPQLAPMWFLYEDGVMYMSTRTYAAKVKHMQKNPRVAVVVDEMVAPLKNKVVTIEGTVEVLTTGVKETTTRIYHKYAGVEGSATPQAQRSINTPRVILKITPTKMETMDTTR